MNISMPFSSGSLEFEYRAELSSPLQLKSSAEFEFLYSAELAKDVCLNSRLNMELYGIVKNGILPQELTEALQQPTIDYIELWSVDLSRLGIGHLNFTNTVSKNGKPVKFGGVDYYPMPIQADGFEKVTSGSNPRPTITVSAKSLEITALLIVDDGLKGSNITRIRTLARFLDDGEEPNPDMHLPEEIYKINRASEWQAGVYVKFELVNALDLENSYFPSKVMQKSYCQYIYRRFNIEKGDFDYSNYNACPYAGSLYFDKMNNPCDKYNDICSKTLDGCRSRFGKNAVLPIFCFPAIADNR